MRGALILDLVFTVGAANQLFEEIITGFFNRLQNDMQFEKIHAQMVFAMRAAKLRFVLQPRDRFLKISRTLRACDCYLL
ncbi:hypothetical protein C8R31_104300 [Nitrosospira sp. Nsp2]|nr:hypothetical protein C8R31_104300 [Nitrosospira sp. Nsp2]